MLFLSRIDMNIMLQFKLIPVNCRAGSNVIEIKKTNTPNPFFQACNIKSHVEKDVFKEFWIKKQKKLINDFRRPGDFKLRKSLIVNHCS